MKKYLNNLYITQPEVNIGREGLTLVIYNDDKKVGQFPAHNFENIICFNYTGMSPAAMALCLEQKVCVSFLTRTGKILGQVTGHPSGNVLLRRAQYRIADDEALSLLFAKLFIEAKLFNSIRTLAQFIKDHNSNEAVNEVNQIRFGLIKSRKRIKECNDLESLRGIEGDTSRNYFQVFNKLILQQKLDFVFNDRRRRPPTDPVNAMLSLTYGMTRVLYENALVTVGLDPYVGFLHRDRPGRKSLALDMMEELRSYLADRFVLTLINRRQITISDFYFKKDGAVLFNDDGIKKYLDLWNKKLQETITHPFLNERISIGLIPYVQSMLLARTLRGDLDTYPPTMIV